MQQIYSKDVTTFLANHPKVVNEYNKICLFVEGLASNWIVASNPKVSQFGLEALMQVAEALQSKYWNYCSTVMTQYITRLRDTKEGLKETVKVKDSNARHMIEKIISLLSHKNSNIGIEALT